MAATPCIQYAARKGRAVTHPFMQALQNTNLMSGSCKKSSLIEEVLVIVLVLSSFINCLQSDSPVLVHTIPKDAHA